MHSGRNVKQHGDQPTTLLSSHPVRRRPTHRGAGVVPGVQVERATVRTTWTPGAASARLRLGRRRTGWEPPPRTPSRTRSRRRRPLHPGAGRSPAGGIFLCPGMLSCPCLHARSAPPGGVAAGEDRAAAPPTRRRAPAPCAGLDEVGKVLSRWDEVLAVVASYVGAVAVQGVQESDCVDLGHAVADLVGCEPGDGRGLA